MRDVDAVVIGSGAGGLSAALALAQAGKKVVVFEQHYLPGGWCHSFSLEGYRFSPGVHYIGELGEGGRSRAVYEGLGLGPDLSFYELNPDGFDLVRIGENFTFDIPKGKEIYAERLKGRFPHEARGIDAYLNTVQRISSELDGAMWARKPAELIRAAVKMPTTLRWALASGKGMSEHFVNDPALRDVLYAQAGDHGAAPSEVHSGVQAVVTSHYFDGGFYPKGGGASLPRAYIRALKRSGGEIHVRTRVDKILMEKNRAIGVRLSDGTEVRSNYVVSNADPHVTFNKLVGSQHLSRLLKWRLGKAKYSVSALSLYFALDCDLRALGMSSGNVWYFDQPDVNRIYEDMQNPQHLGAGRVPFLFITATTLKDPSKKYRGTHTLEAFTFTSHKAFERWAQSTTGNRAASYNDLKAKLTQWMLDGVERVIPNARKHLKFCDLGTPLTNQFYCEATQGNLYGISKIRQQTGPLSFQPPTEIDGLYLCGSSTLSHGILGCTYSGLTVAQHILQCRAEEMLKHSRGPLTVMQSEPSTASQSSYYIAQKSRAPATEAIDAAL